MKILILLNAYHDDGPGNLMLSIVRNLINKGDCRFYTAALSRGGSLKPLYEEMLISTKVLGIKGLFDIKAILSLYKFIKKEKFDIVHTNLLKADLIGRIIARFLKVPVILSTEHGIHTWQVKGKFWGIIIKRLYQFSAKFAKYIIVVSKSVRQDLLKNNLPENKIKLIYNGVDTDYFSTMPKDEKEKMHSYLSDEKFDNLIGVVGNIVPLKGHSYFIDAIPLILEKHPSTMVVFIGEGPLREDLEEKVNQKKLSKNVKFLGELYSILPKMIASMDLFVQPSLIESFGLAVAEAQSCAIPVVASKTGGIPEIILDEKTGFLVAPGNPEQIAEKVNFLLDNPEKSVEMGREGRKHIIDNFNIERTAEAYYAIYDEVLSKKIISFQEIKEKDQKPEEKINEEGIPESKDMVESEKDSENKDAPSSEKPLQNAENKPETPKDNIS